MNALSRIRSARIRASTASGCVAPALRSRIATAASSARGDTGMPLSSSRRTSQAASAIRAMPHDGDDTALTSDSNLPASSSSQAWRSSDSSTLGRTGGASCATMRSMVSARSAPSSPSGASSLAALA